jgi:calcium-dependent protein kinase
LVWQGGPPYIAPEVWNGLYDERVDLWGLGLVILILYIGYNPYDEKSCNYIDWKKMGTDERDFVSKLLTRVNKRMNVEEILNHKYYKKLKNKIGFIFNEYKRWESKNDISKSIKM